MKLTNDGKYYQSSNIGSNYYEDIVAASDIGEVAQELIPDRITDEGSDKLQCDCPNHASISRKSLHIDLKKQLFYCFGCGIGGDVIQFVEFIKAGKISKGVEGSRSESHRKARDYLASRVNMPLLGQPNLSQKELAALELRHQKDSRTYDCLTAIANCYYDQLELHPEALEWFMSNYAISKETRSELKIGFSVNCVGSDTITDRLISYGFNHEEILSTGAFVTPSNDLVPLFQGRITFPYWSRGRGVVYMIGRKTPWTPENKYESSKYKKLFVHSEKRPFVRECINNSILYNEDCLDESPSLIIITEGITDAIAAKERGFSVISPVTVRIKKADQDRLCDKLRGFSGKVIVVQDNEISQAGLQGSRDTARLLLKSGVNARISQLPLGDKQKEARQILLDKYGIDENTTAADRNKKVEGISDETQRQEIADLLKNSKIDINEYFMEGHSREAFQRILDQALTPIEWSIGSLDPELSVEVRSALLEPILMDISALDPTQQEFYLRKIKDLLGDTTLDSLRKHMNEVKKDDQESSKKRKSQFNQLLDLFYTSGGTAFTDQNQCGWVTLKIGDHFENIQIKKGKFDRVMLKMYFEAYGESVDFRTTELMGGLLTRQPTEERYLYNRYAWMEDRLHIDMCRKDWKVIEIYEGKWKIVETDKPVYRRFSHQRPMPLPNKGGDIRKILKYLAVKNEGDQALLLVWLCTCMIDFAPRPGLIIYGSYGSAKTSAADFLRMIVDPSSVMHSPFAKDLTEFVQKMDHHAVISLDNLSTIPQWASDALCGAITGTGFEKRMLYTDDDDISYNFRRVFILSGMSIPTSAPDLLDRAITIELTRISTKGRKREAKLKKEFEADIPDILGGILDVMVQVIERRDEELEEYPRLADWYGLGYIAAEVLGIKDSFVEAFKRSEKDQHIEVVESHNESELLVEFMEEIEQDSWKAKKSDLYRELTKMAEERKLKKNWPKTVSAFGKKLKKLYHNLDQMGFHCEDSTDGKNRMISITKLEPSNLKETIDVAPPAPVNVSGFAVNEVYPVNAGDISNLPLTATGETAVSAVVISPGEEDWCPEISEQDPSDPIDFEKVLKCTQRVQELLSYSLRSNHQLGGVGPRGH